MTGVSFGLLRIALLACCAFAAGILIQRRRGTGWADSLHRGAVLAIVFGLVGLALELIAHEVGVGLP